MARIVIEENVRIILADGLTAAGQTTRPIDFAREELLIADPATGRPLAICRPLAATEASVAVEPAETPIAALELASGLPGPSSDPPAPKVRPKGPGKRAPASVESIDFTAPKAEAIPKPAPTSRPLPRLAEPLPEPEVPRNGKLQPAQVEWLQHELRREPEAPAEWIAERFREVYGRTISPITVQEHMRRLAAESREGAMNAYA